MNSFWEKLGKEHKQKLGQSIGNFKRTINYRYHQWGLLGILRYEYHIILGELLRLNLKPFRYFSLYKIHLACLYDKVARIDKLNLLDIGEPLFGNPYYIYYRGRMITQDLCRSVHEFYSIGGTPKSILEIGAGYGRTAYIFLTTTRVKYCIVDIEPALSISKEYLTTAFPDADIKKNKTYYYIVESADASGNKTSSSEQSFTTPK